MPQVRVDPLTGLKTIIAGERADRPGGGFDVAARPPIDPETDPFLPGPRGPDAARGLRGAPDGGAPTRRAGPCASCPNLYPALDPDAAAPERDANPDLFTAQPAAGAHEVIVNAPEPVTLARGAVAPSRSQLAVEAWRERMRAHADAACRHLIVNERREAAPRSRTRTRSSTRWTSCPPRSPASASASAPTPCARWAATCSPTSCRRRCAGASGSSRSTTRPC